MYARAQQEIVYVRVNPLHVMCAYITSVRVQQYTDVQMTQTTCAHSEAEKLMAPVTSCETGRVCFSGREIQTVH